MLVEIPKCLLNVAGSVQTPPPGSRKRWSCFSALCCSSALKFPKFPQNFSAKQASKLYKTSKKRARQSFPHGAHLQRHSSACRSFCRFRTAGDGPLSGMRGGGGGGVNENNCLCAIISVDACSTTQWHHQCHQNWTQPLLVT